MARSWAVAGRGSHVASILLWETLHSTGSRCWNGRGGGGEVAGGD
jgi:hypothetical protein